MISFNPVDYHYVAILPLVVLERYGNVESASSVLADWLDLDQKVQVAGMLHFNEIQETARIGAYSAAALTTLLFAWSVS